jgi:hypothetical protein
MTTGAVTPVRDRIEHKKRDGGDLLILAIRWWTTGLLMIPPPMHASLLPISFLVCVRERERGGEGDKDRQREAKTGR